MESRKDYLGGKALHLRQTGCLFPILLTRYNGECSRQVCHTVLNSSSFVKQFHGYMFGNKRTKVICMYAGGIQDFGSGGGVQVTVLKRGTGATSLSLFMKFWGPNGRGGWFLTPKIPPGSAPVLRV